MTDIIKYRDAYKKTTREIRLERELEAVQEYLNITLIKYNVLIDAVKDKFPNESRHETALRYIKGKNAIDVLLADSKAKVVTKDLVDCGDK